jgi:hypothetical protein
LQSSHNLRKNISGQLYQFIIEFGYKQLPKEDFYAFIVQQFYDSQQLSEDFPSETSQFKDRGEEDRPKRSELDSPKPSTSGTHRNTVTKPTDKTRSSSKYTRNILFDDSQSSLQSKFADLDLPTKKRASNSPMENSIRKKSLLESLDEDYFGEKSTRTWKNGERSEIDETENENDDVRDRTEISEFLENDEPIETKSIPSKISETVQDHITSETSLIANDDDSDEMIPSSPAAASVQTILQSKKMKAQEQKLKISDFFRPKS